jgi:hypothetical protein
MSHLKSAAAATAKQPTRDFAPDDPISNEELAEPGERAVRKNMKSLAATSKLEDFCFRE